MKLNIIYSSKVVRKFYVLKGHNGSQRSQRSQRQPEKARVLNSAFCEKWDLQGQSGGRGSFQIGSLDERLGTGHGEADCQEVSVSKGQRQYIIKVRVGLVDGGIP